MLMLLLLPRRASAAIYVRIAKNEVRAHKTELLLRTETGRSLRSRRNISIQLDLSRGPH